MLRGCPLGLPGDHPDGNDGADGVIYQGLCKAGNADLRILRWMADRSVHVASGWQAKRQSPMAIRIGAMVVGCVIIALGKAVVIMTDAGSGPNDLFSLIVSDAINKRKKIEFRWIRIVTDIMFTVVGSFWAECWASERW